MKKVLHIKLQAPNFDNNGISNGFRANGYDVIDYDWQQHRFGNGIESLRKRMIDISSETQPDIIFMQIQNESILDLPTVIELSKYGFVINYTFDVRENIDWYKTLAPHIGLTLFGDYESVENCKEDGIENVDYLASSCDTEFYKPVEITKDYGEIIFIGNRYDNTNLNFPFAKERTEMVEYMKKEFGERFKAYGRGYGNQLNSEEEREAYSSAKVVITHNNFHREGYCSDRDFRATACGAFVIHNYYEGIEDDTLYGTSWRTFHQLKRLCVSALLNDYLSKKIAAQEHEFFIRHNTYISRIQKLQSIISKQLIHG